MPPYETIFRSMVVPPLLIPGVSGHGATVIPRDRMVPSAEKSGNPGCHLHHCSCPYLLPSKSKGRSDEANFVSSPRKEGARKHLRIGRVEMVLGREGKCYRPSATWGAQPPPGGHYSGREMPSFFIFFCKVERFIPRRAAAPFGPPTTQPVSWRTPRMCSRSASARVTGSPAGA